ncbi:type II methionyl aminopeptidase [Candidatus Micrarchaeota archaeon CG10_big_fil_rev_8_21_14_0_10_59_7]|nr:MAG: type II methionyl aminopeptidase [Candidatus Micrarchaeota archaeon CG10_big_fil_rev_8_21_14_0_10_59_7]
MDEEELKHYMDAARVAAGVRALAEECTKPGAKLFDIATAIESEVVKEGGKNAFPVNISINDTAAHYTPCIGDETLLGEKDVVKIDFGVHVEGCIIDQAFTVDFGGEHGKLVEAADAALNDALATMKAGVSVRDVGKAIQDAITSRGFKPIENLGGHSLEPYLLHAGEEIPNTAKGSYVLREGDVFAVEPFATTGAGRVDEGNYCEIHSLVNPKPVRLPQSRRVLEHILEEYKTLPFAERWLAEMLSTSSIELVVNDLVRQGILHSYAVLKEINKGRVAQSEVTVIVEKDGVKNLC